MTLAQLTYFMVLAEQRSFTRAANRCAISQPSLTNAIKALETTLGGALFVRKPRVQLTPLGRDLLPHVKSVVAACGRASEVAMTWAHRPKTERRRRS